jgi:anti-anti-sigma factor
MSASTAEGIRISLSTAGSDHGIHVVRVDGRIDTVTSSELDDVIGTLIGRKCCRLAVDLAGTDYVSSAGWGVFISRLRQAREGDGDIRLARMTGAVREVYDLLEFDGLLHTYGSLEDALGAFEGETVRHHTPDHRTSEVVVEVPGAEVIPPPPNGGSTLEDAVLRLVLEDPFYRISEISGRLGEMGVASAGWWAVWRVLRQKKLLRLRNRFIFFRRQRLVPR